jgi:ABC-type glycerol-3-phosphate transport system substrate-binding protein
VKTQAKWIAVLLGLLIALSGWASGEKEKPATGKTGEPVEVRIRTGWNESAFPNWLDRLADYEKENPNIKVTIEWSSGGFGDIQKLRTDFLVGEAPEIVHVWKTDFNTYAAEGLLHEMNSFLKMKGWMDGYFYDGAMRWAAKLDEAVAATTFYGLPDFVFPSVFYYNVDTFKELGLGIPTTGDELKVVLKTIKDSGKTGLILSAAAAGALDILGKIQVQVAGVQPLIDAYLGKGKLTHPDLVKSAEIFEEYASLIDPVSTGLNSADAQSMFGSGEAAICAAHTGHGVGIKQASDVSGTKWSVFERVDFVKNPKTPFSITFGGLWATPKGNQHLDETWDVLGYLFSGKVMGETAELTNRLTNIPSANETVADPVLIKVRDKILPTSSADSFYLVDMVGPKVRDEMMRGIQQMILGEINGKQLMHAAQVAHEASN